MFGLVNQAHFQKVHPIDGVFAVHCVSQLMAYSLTHDPKPKTKPKTKNQKQQPTTTNNNQQQPTTTNHFFHSKTNSGGSDSSATSKDQNLFTSTGPIQNFIHNVTPGGVYFGGACLGERS